MVQTFVLPVFKRQKGMKDEYCSSGWLAGRVSFVHV